VIEKPGNNLLLRAFFGLPTAPDLLRTTPGKPIAGPRRYRAEICRPGGYDPADSHVDGLAMNRTSPIASRSCFAEDVD
jgi:hypothetical protein